MSKDVPMYSPVNIPIILIFLFITHDDDYNFLFLFLARMLLSRGGLGLQFGKDATAG